MDFLNLMKKAQTLQSDIEKAKRDFDACRIEGYAGGDMVRVCLTGSGTCVGVSVDETLLDQDSKSLVEDLVANAINAAMEKRAALRQEHFADVTEGLPIPPNLFGSNLG